MKPTIPPLLRDFPNHFETERLRLRAFQPGDGSWYYAVGQKNRAHLQRYEAGNPVRALEDEEQAEVLVRNLSIRWAARTAFFLAAFEKELGDFVAQVYIGPLNWDLPEFQIGYFADLDHQGRGYVTEAVKAALRFIFEHLQARRVSLECDDTNQRSWGVAERCGLRREGHLRQNKLNPDGSISGTLFYGLLRSEYLAGGPAAASQDR
jgi:ribosomal-protein-alanine N-acetyltransferase